VSSVAQAIDEFAAQFLVVVIHDHGLDLTDIGVDAEPRIVICRIGIIRAKTMAVESRWIWITSL